MVRSMHRCVEHACAGTWWWWCCARACTMHHRGLARVSEAANRKGASGTRSNSNSESNSECAGLSPPKHACVLYYIRAISVRYPHIRTISVRYPYDIHAHGHRDIRARPCAYPPHIHRTSTAHPPAHPPHIHPHIQRTSGFPDVRNTSLCQWAREPAIALSAKVRRNLNRLRSGLPCEYYPEGDSQDLITFDIDIYISCLVRANTPRNNHR